MLYTWRLWTRFKVNTFFFSLCIENHIYRQDRWDERRNFFHWQRKRFSYSGINHTFQPSKSQSLKQFWKINHVLLGFVFLSVVNLKKKYVKKTVNSRNNFSHRLPHNSSNNNKGKISCHWTNSKLLQTGDKGRRLEIVKKSWRRFH